MALLKRNPTSAKTEKRIAQKKKLWFQNLIALQCPVQSIKKEHRVTIHKDLFEEANRSAFVVICHFLFSKLDKKRSVELFQHCYPPRYRKQEQEFRTVCMNWLKKCADDHRQASPSNLSSALFMNPGGPEVYKFLFAFTTYVLNHCTRGLAVSNMSVLHPPFPCHDLSILNFQIASLKSISCSTSKSLSDYLQVFQAANIASRNTMKILLARYKCLSKRVEEARQKEKLLTEKLKNASLHQCAGTSSKFCGSKRSEQSKKSDKMKILRSMWDVITSHVHESATDRTIMQCIISDQHDMGLAFGDMPPTIVAYLIDKRNIEVTEKVGSNLYETEHLNLVSLVKLFNMALQEIEEKVKEGIPNFENQALKAKAQGIIHFKNLQALQDIQQKLKNSNQRLKIGVRTLSQKVDMHYARMRVNKEVLIPGLPKLEFDHDINTQNICFEPQPLNPCHNSLDHNSIETSVEKQNSIINQELLDKMLRECMPVFNEVPWFQPCSLGNVQPLVKTVSTLERFGQKEVMEPVQMEIRTSPLGNSHQQLANLSAPMVKAFEWQRKYHGFDKSLGKKESDSSRKKAITKLVAQIVDHTLQEREVCAGNLPSTVNPPDNVQLFDVEEQLNSSAFKSNDKIQRTPPRLLHVTDPEWAE